MPETENEIETIIVDSDVNLTEMNTKVVEVTEQPEPTPTNNDFSEFMQNVERPTQVSLPLSKAEMIERRRMLLKIKNYVRAFPEILEDFNRDIRRAEELSLDEMELLIEEMKFTVATRNSQELIVTKGFFTATHLTETLLPVVGVHCEGLTKVLMSNKECRDTLTELALEKEIIYVSPEKRLMMIVASTVFQLHQLNKKVDDVKNELSAPVPDEIKAKGANL